MDGKENKGNVRQSPNIRTKLRRKQRKEQLRDRRYEESLYQEARLDPDTLEGQIKLPLDRLDSSNKVSLYSTIGPPSPIVHESTDDKSGKINTKSTSQIPSESPSETPSKPTGYWSSLYNYFWG